MQAVLCLILGVVAVCTFLLKGRQWPTFITACLFGMFVGGTGWGGAVMRAVSSVTSQIIGALQ